MTISVGVDSVVLQHGSVSVRVRSLSLTSSTPASWAGRQAQEDRAEDQKRDPGARAVADGQAEAHQEENNPQGSEGRTILTTQLWAPFSEGEIRAFPTTMFLDETPRGQRPMAASVTLSHSAG